MKLATFRKAGMTTFGAIVDEGVIDLGRRMPDVPDLAALLAGDLTRGRGIADKHAPDDALADIELLKPIERSSKCLCVGVNYADRNDEYKDGSDRPRYPSVFVRFADSFVAHGQPIVRPPESDQLDYEGEIVLVIGDGGRRIPRDTAMGHVAGFTIANDGSIRDYIRHGKFNVTPGKNFDRSGSIGPWIVPLADMPAGPMLVITRVNGKERQNDTTERMLFPFPDLIAYVSAFTTLAPGDLILTGTPAGAGARFDPPRYLKPGDRVEVEVPGIGVLANDVRDEKG